MARTVPFSKILTGAGQAIGISIIINVILFYLLPMVGLLDTEFVIPGAGERVNVMGVIISTVMFMAIGVVIYVLLALFSPNPNKWFTYVVIAGFILTLGNFYFAGVPLKMGIGLDLMHIAPAYFLWKYLTR